MSRFELPRRWTALVAAVLLSIGGCNHPDRQVSVVQLREAAVLEPGRACEGVTVQTSINQRPFSLLVDTGATGVMLFRELAGQANLHEEGSEVGLDAFGRKISVGRTRYDSLVLGDAFQFSQGHLRIADGPGLPFDGLLGLEPLRRIKAVADFSAKQVIVDAATADRLLQTKRAVATLRGELGLLYVQGSIGGNAGVFLIDSGSNVTVVDAQFAAAPSGRSVNVAVVSSQAGAAVGQVAHVEVLGKKWDLLEVHLHEDLGQRPGVAGHRLLGVLGLNLLRSSLAAVDFRTDQVYVAP